MNLEEKDLFLDRMTKDFEHLLFKLFDEIVAHEGTRVLKINLSDPESEKQLLYEKLRAEGSARFVSRFHVLVNDLKKTSGDVITGG